MHCKYLKSVTCLLLSLCSQRTALASWHTCSKKLFCWACPHKEQVQVTDQEHAQVVKLVSHSTRLQSCLLSKLYSQRPALEAKDQQFMDYCSLSFGNGQQVATICLPEEMEFRDRWNFLTLRPAPQKGREIDHNDPSKPSHRLTNGPEPSKTIESDGSNIKKPS